jgi:hypothetical protein
MLCVKMATFEFGTPLDKKKLAAQVTQQWTSHPPKPIHTPPRILPNGVSESQFNEILDNLRKIVGKEKRGS